MGRCPLSPSGSVGAHHLQAHPFNHGYLTSCIHGHYQHRDEKAQADRSYFNPCFQVHTVIDTHTQMGLCLLVCFYYNVITMPSLLSHVNGLTCDHKLPSVWCMVKALCHFKTTLLHKPLRIKAHKCRCLLSTYYALETLSSKRRHLTLDPEDALEIPGKGGVGGRGVSWSQVSGRVLSTRLVYPLSEHLPRV